MFKDIFIYSQFYRFIKCILIISTPVPIPLISLLPTFTTPLKIQRSEFLECCLPAQGMGLCAWLWLTCQWPSPHPFGFQEFLSWRWGLVCRFSTGTHCCEFLSHVSMLCARGSILQLFPVLQPLQFFHPVFCSVPWMSRSNVFKILACTMKHSEDSFSQETWGLWYGLLDVSFFFWGE